MLRMLSLFTLVLSTLILNSLWITNSDEWKMYLPIILITISIYMFKEEKNKDSN